MKDSALASNNEVSSSEMPSQEETEALARQLLERLAQLERGDKTDPNECRSALRQIQFFSWEQVGRGDYSAAKDCLALLSPARRFVTRHLPASPEPAEEIAWELHHLLRNLSLAREALELPEQEATLSERYRSNTKRQVLQVLFDSEGRYLKRSDIQPLLDPPRDVSRVGQILAELYHDRLVRRVAETAQGGQTYFFALSMRGQQVCHRIGLTEPIPEYVPDWRHMAKKVSFARFNELSPQDESDWSSLGDERATLPKSHNATHKETAGGLP